MKNKNPSLVPDLSVTVTPFRVTLILRLQWHFFGLKKYLLIMKIIRKSDNRLQWHYYRFQKCHCNRYGLYLVSARGARLLAPLVRGLPYLTSTVVGRGRSTRSRRKERGCVNSVRDKGEGVQKSGRHIWKPPYCVNFAGVFAGMRLRSTDVWCIKLKSSRNGSSAHSMHVSSCVETFLLSSENHPQNFPLPTPNLHYGAIFPPAISETWQECFYTTLYRADGEDDPQEMEIN